MRVVRRMTLSLGMGGFLASCATVPDFEGCADLREDGARCITYISRKTRDLSEAQFDAIRFGRISLSPQDYAKLKATLEKLCSFNNCSYEQREQVEQAKGFVKQLDKFARHRR